MVIGKGGIFTSVLNSRKDFDSDLKFQAKIELWKQMQLMVMDVEGRNFSSISFSSVASVVTAIIAEYNENLSYFVLVIPIIMLFGIFIISFNNRTSAILRGYLSGIEDELNLVMEEEIFLWNKKYQHLRNKKYFRTNQLSFLLYFIIFAVLDIYSFCKLFTLLNISYWVHIVLFVLYIVIVLFFSIAFAIDLATNGEIKILSRIYFHKHNEVVELEKLKQTDPDDINDDRIAMVDNIIEKYKSKMQEEDKNED